MKTNKILFIAKPHSMVDLITNSSTELFVGINKSKDTLMMLIEEIYPNYLHEYEPLKRIDELSNEEIHTYISYYYDRWSNSQQKTIHSLVPGFTKDEMYTKHKYGEFIKGDFVNDDTREKIIKGIDPNGSMLFLFSLDENPNWEMQEKLMDIMDRYHLG